MKKVFALLVGINDYDRVGKLHGCLNDVKAVRNYLEHGADFDVEIKELTDQAATRAGVADGFQTFLSQAGQDDTVLFYYSGHGTQERAASLWDETDGALECLVCYDGGAGSTPDFLLTDKELRYLIHELSQSTQAHIVTIFDCCHSGDNTRNAALVGASYDETRERRVTDKAGRAFPQRMWSQFLFSDTIQEADVRNRKPAEFLPQGTHVQMAACESSQVALEVAREGVFTKTLLKTLTDCGGNITYNTLRSRIRQYMRAGFEQTPRIYMPLDAENLLRRGFLNQTVDPQKMICEATRNKQEGWQLNVGAIHGMKADSQVTLFDPRNREKTHAAKVRKGGVFVDYTLLDVAGLDTSAMYKAEVEGLMTQELVLELKNYDGNPREVGQLTKELEANASGGFAFGGEQEAVETEKDNGQSQPADYTFHVRSGEVYLTKPGDPYRPLIRPVLYLEDEEHTAILGTLRHVSRWHFIKNLQNEDLPESFPAQPLKIELSRVMADGTSTSVPLANDTAELDYEKSGRSWKGTLQVKITNTTAQDLYACAAYLSKEFQCFLDFLPQRVQLLEAGKSLFLGPNGKDRIALKLGKVEQEYNWPQVVEAFKFIVSTVEFDAEALTLDALPGPLTTDDLEKSRGGKAKGLVTEEDEPLEFSGWLTQTLHLVFKNPVYNRIPAKTLEALLEWDETTYFAAGLFCKVELDETGQPTVWKLKKGLVVPEDEKGLFDDIKLRLGNWIETRQRRKRYRNLKKDPNRLRIVAEGDSWFQYPIILQDTLDQLYKCYAIRSFAEAGDTLENYLKKKEYLDAIEEEDVRFFLVSGGGNDVLGDQFQYFLRETPDNTDDTPRKYLNQKMFDQLDKLDALYTQMFNELFARYPDLHILVHCYDYLIPVDTDIPANKKKSSWTGKHMIKKGIVPQEEREKLIRYIVDEFAGRLTALAQKSEFKDRVTFVDTRGLVDRQSWFDEIHPTNAGYQIVADKFIGAIERIKSQKKKSINDLLIDAGSLSRNELLEFLRYNQPTEAGKIVLGEYFFEVQEIKQALQEKEPVMFEAGQDGAGTADAGELQKMVFWPMRAEAQMAGAEESEPAEAPPMHAEPSPRPIVIDLEAVEFHQEAPSVFRAGQLDYDIPDVMQQNQPVVCVIRIGGAELALEDIKISAESTHASIKITDEMSVRLVDISNGLNFSIAPISTERQAISKGDFTEWKISVTALKAGTFPLFLRVSAHFDGKTDDMEVLEKSVRVNGDPNVSIQEIARQIKKKIIFMAADSKSGLLLGRESNKIREELLMSSLRDEFLYTTLFEVTGFDFSRTLLREKPTIVHFSGHGSSEGIYLVNEHEVPQLAPTKALKKLFGVMGKVLKIECVILNACFSQTQADEVAKSIPVVVGTRSKIGDDEAINFSIGFYQGLGAGLTYEDAYELGRVQVSFNTDDDEAEDILTLLKKSV
ncbi:caspase family protein [Persicitalea jodogahamensis]|uniref:Peptidase C14 caspase domain-containing protein n=1 Tax=Persicitalea jodogahamensis TaxID=402147 RepID=A0A8J3D4J4_9BACT|nr:caspase family protein [Persicitalea jodogahamensis]GHB53270.1 hypothetical protein GCM10007390_02510 [Persicitalea jodogahamensis]